MWSGSEWSDDIAGASGSDVSIPSARAYHNMFSMSGILHVFGGEKPNGKVHTDMWSFNADANVGWWREKGYAKKYLDIDSNRGITARIMKSPLAGRHVFGGFDGKRARNELLLLDVTRGKTGNQVQDVFRWMYVRNFGDASPQGRAGHVFMWDPKKSEALLFGGWRDGEVFGDTWIFRDNGQRWEKIE